MSKTEKQAEQLGGQCPLCLSAKRKRQNLLNNFSNKFCHKTKCLYLAADFDNKMCKVMIREDRIQLNQRFIEVFKLLEERGAIVKNDRNGKGMGDFAEKILGNRAYGHIIRAYLNPKDKRVISYSQARKLCREYGVNESYMLDGIGSPFGMELPMTKGQGPTHNIQPQGNILFTTTEAFAGATLENNSFVTEENSYFSIPGLSGSGLVAFPIQGNSMEPIIMNGDVVICRQTDRLSDIKDNEIYAVKNNGQLWVKYVKKIYTGDQITHLRLISANYLEHDPFTEEVNVDTRLYKVIRRITQL